MQESLVGGVDCPLPQRWLLRCSYVFLYSVLYVFMEFSLLCFVIEYQCTCTGHMGNAYIWEYVAKPYWTYAYAGVGIKIWGGTISEGYKSVEAPMVKIKEFT